MYKKYLLAPTLALVLTCTAAQQQQKSEPTREPITKISPPSENTLPPKELPPKDSLPPQISSLFPDKKLLSAAEETCHKLSLGEQARFAYQKMLQERLRWNERDDCPEYSVFHASQTPLGYETLFIVARQPYVSSCVENHAAEIAEDTVRVLEGRSPIKTQFLQPVSTGLVIGVRRDENPLHSELSYAVFPDVIGDADNHVQYTLDIETLESKPCKSSSDPEVCGLLPLEKILSNFCIAYTAKDRQKESLQKRGP